MTPLQCADGVAYFLRQRIAEYSENERFIGEDGTERIEKVNVFSGFLPRVSARDAKEKLCPAVVVRPETVTDGVGETTVRLLINITTYDDSMLNGHISLYHLLEWIRLQLLSTNPLPDKNGKERWLIKEGSVISNIPDEQPFPQWWGYIECDIYLPQPETSHTSWR